MSNWDFVYKNTTPAAAGVPNITPANADNPEYTTLAGTGLGAFDTTDRFSQAAAQPTDLILFAVGGAGPVCQIYVFAAGQWNLLHDAVTPTPTAPARRRVPPNARLYIRVQTVNAATAIYAGYDVG